MGSKPKQNWVLRIGIAASVLLLASSVVFSQGQASDASGEPAVRFVQETEADYEVFTVTMPPNAGYRLRPITAPKTEKITDLVKRATMPLAGINAGFFDPNNHQTTSYIWWQGKVVANPTQNKHLMDNPDLKPYLPAMLNRSEFRVYQCGKQTQYEVTRHLSPVRAGCRLESALQAGPNLLVEDSATREAFIATNAKGQRTRDPLGVDRPNARSAIGINQQGQVMLMMVGMRPKANAPTGVTLAQLKQLMLDHGAVQALALDGGSSSSLWFNGQTYYGKLDKDLQPVERPVKSAWVIETETH